MLRTVISDHRTLLTVSTWTPSLTSISLPTYTECRRSGITRKVWTNILWFHLRVRAQTLVAVSVLVGVGSDGKRNVFFTIWRLMFSRASESYWSLLIADLSAHRNIITSSICDSCSSRPPSTRGQYSSCVTDGCNVHKKVSCCARNCFTRLTGLAWVAGPSWTTLFGVNFPGNPSGAIWLIALCFSLSRT